MLSISSSHAEFNFGEWVRNLFGINKIDQSKYELTQRGYRIKKTPAAESTTSAESSDDVTVSIEVDKNVKFQLPAQANPNDPPFRAPVGSIWLREGNTWRLVTNEEFVEQKESQVRDSYAEVLGAKFPIKKSIYVYNVEDGQERMLKARDNYKIQVAGYGPRGSIRVNVFDKNDNQIPGDFITIPKNVTAGTDNAMANQALDALKEIQAAGDVAAFCRVDADFGVVADGGVEIDKDENATPSTRPQARPETLTKRYDDYRPGCEALADGVTQRDSARLKECANSLISYINSGTRNMCQKLEKIFSLNEQEQDFIGMLFATKAESPGGLPAGSPDHLMIMKSLDNRRSATLRSGWSRPVSISDIAFQFDQYSAFNDHNNDNQFDAPAFLNNSGYEKLVDSFIAYHSAEWKPPGVIDNVTHYYSPPAMVPRNSTPRWVTGGISRNGAREVTSDIRVNGQPVVNSRNSSRGYHKFYVGIDGRNNYNASRDTRRQIVNQCR